MEEKECPFCGTKIPIDATKCFSCKNWVDDSEEEYIEEDEQEESDKPVEFLPTLLFAYFLGIITSLPPIYILSFSGILTLPSACKLFSRKAISILGGATQVLLRV